jgi:putative oxidoreductase
VRVKGEPVSPQPSRADDFKWQQDATPAGTAARGCQFAAPGKPAPAAASASQSQPGLWRHARIVSNSCDRHTDKGQTVMNAGSEKLFFPAIGPFYERLSPYAYSFMRFATGAVLVPHGLQKVFFLSIGRYSEIIGAKGLPFPELLAYATFFTESVAAACLAIGLFTRVAAAMIAIEMLVIVFFFQWSNGYFWTNRGYEYALLWLLLCIAIFFRGGGRYSVDRLIGKEF